jgi:hypothetical protein
MSLLKSSKAPETVAPALKELLHGLFDYAGLFPPAKLPIKSALDKFSAYRTGDYSWMLQNFVLPASEVDAVPAEFDRAMSVVAGESLPRYEVQARVAAVETAAPVGMNATKNVVFCQVPPNKPELLDQIKRDSCYAKIRMGGLKAEDIPPSSAVAQFMVACAERALPFKATAGLHHPIRATYPLTYDANAPRAVMHGFINVVMAAAFAWHGDRQLEPILEETDASAFKFDDKAQWRDRVLTTAQVKEARQKFFLAIGSCSFEEPVQDLQALGLL